MKILNSQRYQKIIFAIVITILLVSCNESNNSFRQLDELYKKEKYDEILQLYAEKKDKYEKDPQLINKIGMTYHNLHEYLKAIECYEKAIRLDNNIPVFYSNKGLSEIELGEFISASISCKKAIELDDDNFLGYVNRSYAFIKLKKWEWALEDLTKAISMKGIDKKEMGFAYANLGTVYLNMGEDEKAFGYSNTAISMNNQLSWAYKNRAFLKMKEQKVGDAIIDINIGLQLKPNDETLLYYKGLIFVKTGKEEEGCDFMAKAIDLINDIESDNYKKISNSVEKYCKEVN